MSRTPITPDDPDLGHLVPPGQIAYVVDGPDRVVVREARDETGALVTNPPRPPRT